jgi:hypothetical protein
VPGRIRKSVLRCGSTVLSYSHADHHALSAGGFARERNGPILEEREGMNDGA